jgi:A/G-specific adenine glycosylase
MAQDFAGRLIIWYKNHMRDLPWRETRDPYRIWLSEIILQQTRVQQGLPYYEKFVATYPTVQDLAQAPVDEVLRLWQGLGYYSRARNLHACAQMVVDEFDGKFPDDYEALMQLKGIGKYTGAAIASFAFHKRVPVVDGNVFRVLSRVLLMEQDIANTKNFKFFFDASKLLMPEKASDLYNQAMMELGATICTPNKPACLLCPVETFCLAKEQGRQSNLPVKLKKVKVRQRFFYYLVIQKDDQLLLGQRGPKDIWQGLYDFPLLTSEQALDEEALLNQLEETYQLEKDSLVFDLSKPIKHLLTHQKIEARFIHITSVFKGSIDNENYQYYNHKEVESLPKPVLINNYLKENYL